MNGTMVKLQKAGAVEIEQRLTARNTLPATQEEWDEAKRKLVAIIKNDLIGHPSLAFIYEGGLIRIKFPSGDVYAAREANANTETAIGSMQEVFTQTAERLGVTARIEVHRFPVGCDRKGFLDWLDSIGLDYEMHTMEEA